MKQYIVQKYVMANSVKEALKKSVRLPVHEIFLHGSWFEKSANYEFFPEKPNKIGLRDKP